MTEDELNVGFPAYSYKPLAQLFSNEDITAPDFGAFTNLLPNVETMSIYWDWDCTESIVLNPLVMCNLLESVQFHSKMKKIDIVNPKCDVMEIAEQNKERFEAVGWTLKKQSRFQSIAHPQVKKGVPTLCIERM